MRDKATYCSHKKAAAILFKAYSCVVFCHHKQIQFDDNFDEFFFPIFDQSFAGKSSSHAMKRHENCKKAVLQALFFMCLTSF